MPAGVKGFRVVQKMENGKLKVTLERLPFYGRDASVRIRQRNSKRVRVQKPQMSGLFSPVKP